MKKTARITFILLMFFVYGCAAGPSMKDYRAACIAYGFRTGTDAFAGCIQREYIAALQAYEHRRSAMGAAIVGGNISRQPIVPKRVGP